MDHLIECLDHLAGRTLGTVVHIGAGDTAVLEAYDRVRLQRLVLVEGDPETAALLKEAAAKCEGVRVLATAVAPEAGSLVWFRYNLARLNGPVDWESLTSIYPRLRRLDCLSVRAAALRTLLEQQVDITDGSTDNVLVLNVPGQEGPLLASLPAELQHHFTWVVLCTCSAPLGPSESTPSAALQYLQRGSYGLAATAGDADTLWPAKLLRFDATSFELRTLRDRLDTAIALQQSQTATIAEQQRQREALEQDRAALEAAARQSSEELRQVSQARDGLALSLSQAQTQIASLNSALGETRKQAAERESLVQQLMKVRDELTRQSSERQVEIEALQRERTLLAEARDEQARARRQEEQRSAQLESALAELTARHGLLQEELVKAEAQIELITDLLLREPQA